MDHDTPTIPVKLHQPPRSTYYRALLGAAPFPFGTTSLPDADLGPPRERSPFGTTSPPSTGLGPPRVPFGTTPDDSARRSPQRRLRPPQDPLPSRWLRPPRGNLVAPTGPSLPPKESSCPPPTTSLDARLPSGSSPLRHGPLQNDTPPRFAPPHTHPRRPQDTSHPSRTPSPRREALPPPPRRRHPRYCHPHPRGLWHPSRRLRPPTCARAAAQ